MRRRFRYRLKEGLKKLPVYTPPGNSWEDLVQQLDVEAAIAENLRQLPLYEPGPRTWEAISGRILPAPQTRIRFSPAHIALAAVLVLALVFTGISLWHRGLSIETEAVKREAFIDPDAVRAEPDPIRTIEALCRSGAPVCQTELFSEKLALYSELSEELEQLETVINRIGESPEIVRSMIRIENLKSNTLQELILLIHS